MGAPSRCILSQIQERFVQERVGYFVHQCKRGKSLELGYDHTDFDDYIYSQEF